MCSSDLAARGLREGAPAVVGQRAPGDSPGPGTAGSAPGGARPVGRRRPTPWSRPPRASAGRAVPAAPAPAPDHDSAARGPGQVPRRTRGPAATRGAPRRRHRPGPGRARADGRPREGARGAHRHEAKKVTACMVKTHSHLPVVLRWVA